MNENHNKLININNDKEFVGIIMMLSASLLFAGMSFFIKKLTTSYSTMEIVFYRNFVSLVLISVSLFLVKPVNIGGRSILLIMRGIFGFTAMFFYFYSISTLSLATASAFSKTSPLFTALFALLFLKEKSSISLISAVIIGFTGVVMILKPSGEGISLLGSAAGLGCGIFAALAYASIRGLANYYDARVVVLSFSIVGVTGSIFYFIFQSIFGMQKHLLILDLPSIENLFYIIMVGILAALAQFLLSKSYYYGRAALVSTVSYSELIFSMIFGIFAGDGLPDVISFTGIVFICFCGILIIKDKNR